MSPEDVRKTGALYMKLFHSSGVVGERTQRNLSLEPSAELVSKDEHVGEMAMKRFITMSKIVLDGMKVSAEEFPHDECVQGSELARVRSHIASMLPQMELFLADFRRDKALRWMGFIGGVHAARSLGRGCSHVYCCGVIAAMNQATETDNMEVALHHLGFIQGVLWATGVYSIDELRQHRKS